MRYDKTIGLMHMSLTNGRTYMQFSDAARLLNFYQLWLDDLYPRAKFADGLSMIEKLGHSKRLQTMRRTWIDEEKPGHSADPFEDTLPERTQKFPQQSTEAPRSDPNGLGTEAAQQRQSEYNTAGGRNEIGQGLFMSDDEDGPQGTDKKVPVPGPVNDDSDDDLDALLREQGDGNPTTGNPSAGPEPGDDVDDGRFNDDLDILRELEEEGP